jgi:hypothetical protein
MRTCNKGLMTQGECLTPEPARVNNFDKLVPYCGRVRRRTNRQRCDFVPVGFTDLRQVRIRGVIAPTVPDSGAALSLLGASLICLAFLRHKLAALKEK